MIAYKTSVITLSEFKTLDDAIIANPVACYTIYGDLNKNKKNALFFHGFSSNSELHTWWEKFNFNRMLRTYNIICINSLGSSHGTVGPSSIDPLTQKPYFFEFPKITIQDTVNFAVTVLNQLRIDNVDLVLGCSLGGMQALDLYLRYPELSKKFISVAGSHVPYMTKLLNLAQARLVDEAAVDGDITRLQKALGFSRFFFRLSCTTEDALEVLNDKKNKTDQERMLDALENYFVEDNLKFQTQFSPYSNSLYLKLIANFELSEMQLLAKVNKQPELLLVSIENDLFTPEKYVKSVFDKIHALASNIFLKEFNTKFGHEAWIVDGERFYAFIEKDLNL